MANAAENAVPPEEDAEGALAQYQNQLKRKMMEITKALRDASAYIAGMNKQTLTVAENLDMMHTATAKGQARNYTTTLDLSAGFLVETERYPAAALEVFSRYNLEKPMSDEDTAFLASRGVTATSPKQGDYREGMGRKVVDCLNKFPGSKRAIIYVPNDTFFSHETDDDAKCMSVLHLYLENDKLNGTVFFRAQACQIYPKNIHFVGTLMSEVASSLQSPVGLGTLFYHAAVLVRDCS